MRRLVPILLTLTVLLGSTGVGWGTDLQKRLAAAKGEDSYGQIYCYDEVTKKHYSLPCEEPEHIRVKQIVRKENSPWVRYYDNGQVQSKGTYKDGKEDGPWVRYYDNGQVQSEGTYKNGKEVGPWVRYYDYGRLQSKGIYKDGKEVGPWVNYHYNRQVQSKGTYKGGNKDGPWVSYHDDGQLKSKGTYKGGIKDGPWVNYDWITEGQSKGTYKDGKKIGPWISYYNDGQLRSKVTYKDGEKEGPWGNYRKGGQLWEKGTYKDGKKIGPWVWHHKNGKLSSKGTYKSGNEDGPWVSYHDNGKLSSKGTYKSGIKDGPWVSYYDNGQVWDKVTYKEGREIGPWASYHKDGGIDNTINSLEHAKHLYSKIIKTCSASDPIHYEGWHNSVLDNEGRHKSPPYMIIIKSRDLDLNCFQKKLSSHPSSISPSVGKIVNENFISGILDNAKVKRVKILSLYAEIGAETREPAEEHIIIDDNIFYFILYRGAVGTDLIKKGVLQIRAYETAYRDNYIFNLNDNSLINLADGGLEFEEDEIIVRQRKSYFEHGGAFWYDIKIDYQGRYIELLNYVGSHSQCYPYEKFSHMSEQFRNALKKQKLKQFCILR